MCIIFPVNPLATFLLLRLFRLHYIAFFNAKVRYPQEGRSWLVRHSGITVRSTECKGGFSEPLHEVDLHVGTIYEDWISLREQSCCGAELARVGQVLDHLP